jgi:hypothetical protein
MPFVGSNVSMGDAEGSAYVARDNSLWLADDGKDVAYELNATTGALKRLIGRPSGRPDGSSSRLRAGRR